MGFISCIAFLLVNLGQTEEIGRLLESDDSFEIGFDCSQSKIAAVNVAIAKSIIKDNHIAALAAIIREYLVLINAQGESIRYTSLLK